MEKECKQRTSDSSTEKNVKLEVQEVEAKTTEDGVGR